MLRALGACGDCIASGAKAPYQRDGLRRGRSRAPSKQSQTRKTNQTREVQSVKRSSVEGRGKLEARPSLRGKPHQRAARHPREWRMGFVWIDRARTGHDNESAW